MSVVNYDQCTVICSNCVGVCPYGAISFPEPDQFLDAFQAIKRPPTAPVIVALGLALISGCSDGPQKAQEARRAAAPPPVVAPEKTANTTQILAFYFHGTVRCETCLRIEKQAQELMGSRFASQVVFRSVNYDEPENAHFSKDYKLPCPSLVLVRQKDGKDQEWKLLGQTWDHVQIPPKLDQYIEEETDKFLQQ